MSLIDLIKRTAIKAVETTNPVNALFGTVVTANPLEINVESRMTLTEEFLVPLETVRTGLKPGDKVSLLRVQGGQQFIILDKVVT